MNANPTPPATCPQCGAPVPEHAAHGLCPRCVFAKAMAATGGPAIEPPDLEAVRAAFPQLEVLELIGTGGMGVVFKARQPQLDRFVALKLLAPERTDDARFAERFATRGAGARALSHPHIVTIHDFGQAGGFFFLLMEFVDGVNLRQAMTAGASRRSRRWRSCRRFARRCNTRTSTASCIATSSRRTCCSTARAA